MKHPYQILATNKAGTHLFASVKNVLQVFDLSTGHKIGEWIDSIPTDQVTHQNSQVKISKKKGEPIFSQPIYNYIRALRLSYDEKYIIGTTDSDKSVFIISIDFTNETNCLTLMKRQPFPKRPCSISIDDKNANVVVADKFGDVYVIPIDNNEPIAQKELEPVLGHVSMLSDVLMTKYNNKQFIITADRDEHIRVSNYPKSYVIKDWLFGHEEFVSELYIDQNDDPSVLYSGGGDDFVCLWKWYDNKLLTKVDLRSLIEEYLHDGHLPPERFLTDDSKKEISVAKLLTVKTERNHLLIVLVENTRCLLTFTISEDYTVVQHKQTIAVENSIIDICVDPTNKKIIASLDTENQDELLQILSFDDQDQLAVDSQYQKQIIEIANANPCDVENRSEFHQLYYINSLRKRSEH
ncbi:TRM82 [[Candida] subhashii]|uniref:TRM82 n=1 Tax=[Candida] subhashii TaxID=561895 RepID=A0A8J5QPL8_9ASCO|nr:TRM82 [[Candida] subhashii]KAG7663382.1 TRM82 [[Candida] subhashii]